MASGHCIGQGSLLVYLTIHSAAFQTGEYGVDCLITVVVLITTTEIRAAIYLALTICRVMC